MASPEVGCKDPRYKQFSDSVERSLKLFEDALEWQDIITCLTKLHKVLLAYPQFSVIPHKLSVYKRLSQCLLPGLPGGIHSKVLEVYITTFKRIGSDGVLADLSLISVGLFPLMSHASMHVRSLLLDLYDGYLLPLGKKLIPALEGIMLAVLPAVEENKEQNVSSRVITFLNNLLKVTEARTFNTAFWNILGRCSKYRLQCLLYWHAREGNRIHVGDDISCTVSALVSCLTDPSTLVTRLALETVATMFPFHSHQPLEFEQQVQIVIAALEILVRHDVSLFRRFSSWLDGSSFVVSKGSKTHIPAQCHSSSLMGTEEDRSDASYFRRHSSHYLKSAVTRLMPLNSSIMLDVDLPVKVVTFLIQHCTFGMEITDDLFADIILYVSATSKLLLDQRKHSTFVFNVQQLLCSMKVHYVFAKGSQLFSSIQHSEGEDGINQVTTIFDVFQFLVHEIAWEPSVELKAALESILMDIFVYVKNSVKSLVADEIVLGLNTCATVLQKLEQIELALDTHTSLTVKPTEGVQACGLTSASSCDGSGGTLPVGTFVMAENGLDDQLHSRAMQHVDNGSANSPTDGDQNVTRAEREVVSLDRYQSAVAVASTELFASLLMVFPKGTVISCFLEPLFSILMSPLIVPTFSAMFFKAYYNDCPQWFTSLCTLCTECNLCDENAVSNSVLAIDVYCRILESCKHFSMCDSKHTGDSAITEKSSFILSFNEKIGLYKSILQLLWDCLTPGSRMCNMAGVMIGRLHSLCHPHALVEDLVLQQICGLVPTFPELQKLVNLLESAMDTNVEHPLNRCILKCLAGLSGSYGSHSMFIADWIIRTLQKGKCAQLFQPIFCMLMCSNRQLVCTEDGAFDVAQVETNLLYQTVMQLTECLPGFPNHGITVDPERLLFALSQFQVIVRVHPVLVVKSLYGCHIPGADVGCTDKGEATMCTALERLVRDCVLILVASEAGVSFQGNNQLTDVNIACLDALGYLCDVFCNFPTGSNMDGLHLSAEYFFSLLTLCEVQSTVFAVLQHWLKCASDCNSSFNIRVCTQSLAVLHSIIVLESQVESITCGTSAESLSIDLISSQQEKPFLLPGSAVVHQPLLWSIMLQLITAQHCQARLAPIAGFFVLSLMDCTKSVNDLVLSHFLSMLSDVLLQITSTKKDGMSLSDVESIDRHRLTLVTMVPGFLQGWLFQQFGMDSFEDFETGIFKEPPLIDWKDRLLKESRISHNDSPEMQQLPSGKLKSVIWGFLGRQQQLPSPSRETFLKSDGDGHRAIIDVTPKVLKSIVSVWANFCTKASENSVLGDAEISKKIQGASSQHTDTDVQSRIKDVIRRVLIVVMKNNNFLIAVLLSVWVDWLQPFYCNVLIDMLHQTGVAPLDTLLIYIREAVVVYGQCGDDTSTLRQEYLLQFVYKYLSSMHLKSDELLAHRDVVTRFVKEIHRSTGHYGSLCLLTSIVHVVVCRCPFEMPKKDLQVLSGKLCESLSHIAGISADSGFVDDGHTRNEAQQGPSVLTFENERLQTPAVQALSVLSNVLPHFLDLLYPYEEKDAATHLLKSVMVHIRPHLVNHSSVTSVCHRLTVKLIASVSRLEYAFAAWKKDVFDYLQDDNFFAMDESLFESWLTIIDNMMIQDRLIFRRLLGYIPGAKASLSGVVHFFSNAEQNYADYGRILRRVAFVLLAGDVDQYSAELPDIRMMLFEGLKQFQMLDVILSAYLLLQVLLIRINSSHLNYMWPTIMTELMAGVGRLVTDFESEAKGTAVDQNQLQLHLGLCKVLEHMLSIPAARLPQFQFTRWAFCDFHSCSAWDDLAPFLQQSVQCSTTCSILRTKCITSLQELIPFLSSLMASRTGVRCDSAVKMETLRLQFLL